MADGRNFSSWQPDALVNNKIRKQENITSNWAYRQYLMNNATTIMKFNNLEACTDLGLPSHTMMNTTPSSNVPHLYSSNFDTSNPGYSYKNSDLKNPYLSREQLQSRMISPQISSNQFH
jgi:hypothetical protein